MSTHVCAAVVDYYVAHITYTHVCGPEDSQQNQQRIQTHVCSPICTIYTLVCSCVFIIVEFMLSLNMVRSDAHFCWMVTLNSILPMLTYIMVICTYMYIYMLINNLKLCVIIQMVVNKINYYG